MATLRIGTAKSATNNLSMGGNTGTQANAPSTGITLGQGTINQTPVPAGTVLGTGVSGGGGGTVYSPYVGGGVVAPVGPTAAQTDPLLASLASLQTILANRNNQSQAEYDRALASYNAQDALDKGAYDENVHQNEQSLTSNNQRALLNAANGATGLRGVLSSLGALTGSGVDVIKRLVGLAANADSGAARETFDVNTTNLGQAWGRAEQQQRQRRQDADATLENNRQNNMSSKLSAEQSIYEQLANLYGDGLPEGQTYASKASALAAPIAATTRATVAPYQAPSASFTPAALQNYLAGTQNLQVDTSGGTDGASIPVNSPLFAAKRKDQLAGVA